MRFESLMQHHLPSLHLMSSRITGLLIAARENKGCIGVFMNVATDNGSADCLPYSHEL